MKGFRGLTRIVRPTVRRAEKRGRAREVAPEFYGVSGTSMAQDDPTERHRRR